MTEDDEYIEQREELEDVAQNIYEIDKRGIVLNGVIAALGGILASIMGVTVGNAGATEALLLFSASFAPMFTLKVVAEYAKQRAVKEGQIQAWMRGVRDSDKVQFHVSDVQPSFWLQLYNAANSACLVRHSIFDNHIPR